MTPDDVAPLSRPFSVLHLPPQGTEVEVETTAEERGALARDLGLPAIEALSARFHVRGTPARVHVRGRVSATIVQSCVVTLEDFASELAEEVEVTFRAPAADGKRFDPAEEVEADLDAPDDLVGDRIDLGAITAEFLALGLDPYPRKPGVEFAADPEEGAEGAGGSPFAALARLRQERGS
ncbi:YceD family protein [Enterovirga aerilata]|uniref:DUF177 domain-containing protein n=1 Tax=Enterovirga aerilata TaxID=2730920 RepID=A0A849I835_9HYPH|nr:DUF177 domain-containing protein [Enterovirga sp. DB1703]NNM72167.1 DUF177 domain-containing protein [Enterovirga sp. DB1703]